MSFAITLELLSHFKFTLKTKILEKLSLLLDLWIRFIFVLIYLFLQDTEDDPGSPPIGVKIKRSVSTAACNVTIGPW